MRLKLTVRRKTIAATIAAVFLGALLFGGLWAWSGVYSVAASKGHFAIVEWLLHFTMRSSVRTHAIGIEAPKLDGQDRILLGAGHFHSECAFCHGAPGFAVGESVKNMLPPPPPLEKEVLRWNDGELFWIVRNGIKYTGMPAFPSLERDDEVWAIVAFLKQLPELDEKQYRELAFGKLSKLDQPGREIARLGTTDEAIGACARCHGMEDEGPRSKLVPLLHGQSVEYLLNAIQAYADGTRQSGVMQPPASALSLPARKKVAEYYASLKPPGAQRNEHPSSEAEKIANKGSGIDIPPCMQCHSGDALATFPRLAGQNAEYMSLKLRLWKNGLAPRSATAEIMAPIARRLSEQQIDELTNYFAGLPATTVGKRP